MNLRDLFLRIRAMVVPRRVERELDEELAFHIEREMQKHIAAGLSPPDARARALARFGPVPLAADQCRDARGTAFVDALVRDILYAFRTFRRAPLTAFTIVATVALGLGLITVVFTFYNRFFLRVDAVRNPEELFAVEALTAPGSDLWVPLKRTDYDALRRETSVFTDAVGMARVRTRIEGRPMNSALVTGNFFQMLGVQAALGRPLTPADDGRSGGQPVIVLSDRGWHKLFGGNPGVIGRQLRISGLPYEVVGVMPEDFRGLGIGPPDYWAPLSLVGRFREGDAGKEDGVSLDVIGRLRPGISAEAATAALTVWASGRSSLRIAGDRPAFIRLRPRNGTSPDAAGEALLITAPIFFAFGLILMIGCANVANLLLARGVSRQREIGIRLSLGASRGRIVRQLLTESFLLALAAAAGGFAVSRLFLAGALYAATSTMPPELGEQLSIGAPEPDWRVLVFLVAGAIVSTVFFALMPALQATRLELVRTMRGELTRDARPGRSRQVLIALQVGASALLLICAAIFLRSAFAAATVNPGVRTSDTIVVNIINESRRAALIEAVTAHPLVTAVAAASPLTLAVAEASSSNAARGTGVTGQSSTVQVDQRAVSPEYFALLDIVVARGRGFTPAERTVEAGVVVVSETIARRLWPNQDAIGQVVRLQSSRPDEARSAEVEPSREFTVVGVVGALNGPLAPDMFPSGAVYAPTDPEHAGTSLTVRVRGDPEQARQALLERLLDVDPGLGQVNTMRTLAGMQTYILQIAFGVTVVLGGLALALTLSGLFSVLSYVVEQRAKEIGVRMALGATTKNVMGLVLSQSLRPVAVGLVVGGGLAAALAVVIMSSSAASEIGNIVHVLDPVAYAASLLVIVSSCALAVSVPALRAARIDPIVTLRRD